MAKLLIAIVISIPSYLYATEFREFVTLHTDADSSCGCKKGEVLLCEDERKAFAPGEESERDIVKQFKSSCGSKDDFMTLKRCYCYSEKPSRAPASVNSIQEKSCSFGNAKLIRISADGEKEISRCTYK